MRSLFLSLLLIAGCSGQSAEQREIVKLIQSDYGTDKITIVKWFGTVKDADCDLSADDVQANHLKSLAPFMATRVQYRVANRLGQQELHDSFIVLGKSFWEANATAFEPGDPIHEILKKL